MNFVACVRTTKLRRVFGKGGPCTCASQDSYFGLVTAMTFLTLNIQSSSKASSEGSKTM